MFGFPQKFSYLLYLPLAGALFAVSCAGTGKNAPAADLQNRKNLAASYARGGDFVSAIKEITAVEEAAGDDPEVHLIKGIAYFGLKDLDEAERSYKKAIEIKSDYTKARYNLCGLHVKMNRPDSAIEHCSAAARDIRYPLRYAALVNIAKAYDLKNDHAAAERFLKESLKLEPSNIYSRNEYGKLLVKLSREKEAIRHFKTALKSAPGYNEARLNLAIARMKTGDLKSACLEFRQVARNKPLPETASITDGYIEKSCGSVPASQD